MIGSGTRWAAGPMSPLTHRTGRDSQPEPILTFMDRQSSIKKIDFKDKERGETRLKIQHIVKSMDDKKVNVKRELERFRGGNNEILTKNFKDILSNK